MPETDEEGFNFAARTEEIVGGDRVEEPKRLQTERPNHRTHGRVILTLHYDIPRDVWEPHDGDAVDVLRRMVGKVDNLAAWVADQVNNNGLVVDIDLEATK